MDIIKKIFNNKSVGSMFASVYDWWRDENDIENIETYGKVMFNAIDKMSLPQYHAKYIKATSSPFGIIIQINDVNYHIFVKEEKLSIILCCKKNV